MRAYGQLNVRRKQILSNSLMRRITVTFSDASFLRLQAAANQKELSLAEYIRTLVETGCQVEEMTLRQTTENTEKKPSATSQDKTKNRRQNNLACVLESRYLLRYLVDNLAHIPREKRALVLTTVKEKAQAVAAELVEA